MRFGDASSTAPADVGLTGAVPTDRQNTAWFDSSAINADNLGSLNVVTSGSVAVDAPLTLAAGAQINLIGTTVNINADVTAHGGTMSIGDLTNAKLGAVTNDVYWSVVPSGSVAAMAVSPGVTIDLTGLWTNAFSGGADLSGLGHIDGGNFTASTTGSVTFGKGAAIDVSSGGAILQDGSTVRWQGR